MDNLIFDRKNQDVTKLKTLRTKVRNRTASTAEYEEWLSSLKGAYNITDLNRVGEVINYLSDVLNSYGYSNNAHARTDWEITEKPNPEQMAQYLENLNKIRYAYFINVTTPELPPDMNKLTFEEANNIEKMLQDITDLLAYATQMFVYSGVANSAQDRLWQHRFRKSKVWATQNYMLSQYLDTDTVLTISSRDTGIIESGTDNLDLAQLNEHQKVVNSIATLNNSMNKIDDLVGYPVGFYTIRNMIPDPSFEHNKWNDTNNNSAYSTTEKAFGNRSLYFAVGTTIVANIEIERPIVGHKYYGRRYIKTNGDNQPDDCRFEVFGGDGANKNWVYAWNNGNHPNWEFGSAIHEIAGVDYADRTIIRCFNVNTTADTWVDGLMLVDLTECFGQGNEPSLGWCDANIPYIEGTQTITVRKEDK